MIAGVILAGGEGRRLGGVDKPLLMLGGIPILARIAAALDLPALAINANGDPARYAGFGFPVLPDGPFQGQGPLAGVLAGLIWARAIGADSLLTVPGDTPFVPPGLAAALSPAPACAASGTRTHHLAAVWSVTTLEALRAHLTRPGPRHVVRFTETISMRKVDFPVLEWDPFFNINSQDDLDQARARIQTQEIPA